MVLQGFRFKVQGLLGGGSGLGTLNITRANAPAHFAAGIGGQNTDGTGSTPLRAAPVKA